MDELLEDLNKYGRFSIVPRRLDYELIQHRDYLDEENEIDDIVFCGTTRQMKSFIAGMIYAIERSELI